jgi:ceramide glucosyltransferase
MPKADLILFVTVLVIPLFWWVLSWRSVSLFLRTAPEQAPWLPQEALSLFKPLPPLKNPEERERYAESLASFSRQLKAGDEMLILCEPQDEAFWKEKAAGWETAVPGLGLKVLVPEPDHPPSHSNPKIKAMALLAPLASRELWWWSDADITVPDGGVERIRAEFAACPCALQTQAYVIPQIRRAEDWLDAMFVHIELLPGLTFLSRQKNVNFACGGSLLFHRKTLEERVDWDELGSQLADDNFLGRKMQPVRLGRSLMRTQSGEEGLCESWRHYFRWQKTVRWCQPAGFAGLFFLQPFWLTLVACCSWISVPAAALLGILLFLLEAVWVFLLFRRLGIRGLSSVFWITPLWSVVRSATWFLCWLPVAVNWSGTKWWKSKAGSVKS